MLPLFKAMARRMMPHRPNSLPHQDTATGPRLYCPGCGEVNPPEGKYCRACWTRLDRDQAMSEEASRELRLRRERQLQRQRRARTVLFAVFALALGGVVAYQTVGRTAFVPRPASAVSSDSGPREWAMLGRDLGRTGFMPDVPPLQGQLQWQFRAAGPLLSSPTVADGRVFLATGDRRIVALDSKEGRLLWEFPVTGPVDSAPAEADGLVYVGLRDGRSLALDASTGDLRWSFQTGNPVISSPVVQRGTVYVASGDGFLYALDAKTGTKRWAYEVKGWIVASPALADNVVVVASSYGSVHLVDAATGRHRTHFDTGRPVQGTPVVSGTRAYIPVENGRLVALDWRPVEYPFERAWMKIRFQLFVWGMIQDLPVQKGLLWVTSFRRTSLMAGPALGRESLYVGTTDGLVRALDSASQERRWEFKTGGPILAGPVVAGDTLYVGSGDGRVYALDTRTGHKQWEFTTGGAITASAAVADGTLYVPSRDGTLYAFK